MEQEAQTEHSPAFTFQHANGERFTATNIEAARRLCPVLGEKSMEDVELLLDLYAKGTELLAEEQAVEKPRPVIKKIERVKPVTEKVTKDALPVAKETEHQIVHQRELATSQEVEPVAAERVEAAHVIPIELDEEVAHLQHEDTLRTATVIAETKPEPPVTPSLEIRLVPESLTQQIFEAEAYRRAEVEAVETEAVQTLEAETVPSSYKVTSPQRIENEIAEPIETFFATENEIIENEPMLAEAEAPIADPLTLEPAEPELFEEADTVVEIPIAEIGTIDAGIEEADFSSPESIEVEAITDTLAEVNAETDVESLDAFDVDYGVEAAVAPAGFTPAEALQVIEIPELPATVMEIETTMEKLVDVLGAESAADTVNNDEPIHAEVILENDAPTKAEVILKQIISLPAELEIADFTEVTELEQKLEELFVELFEAADIDFTPELIESFVKLTKTHYLEKLLEVTSDRVEEISDSPDEIGTREFLQKLRQGLRAMKQAAANVYEIGRSLLRLYAASFEPVPAR